MDDREHKHRKPRRSSGKQQRQPAHPGKLVQPRRNEGIALIVDGEAQFIAAILPFRGIHQPGSLHGGDEVDRLAVFQPDGGGVFVNARFGRILHGSFRNDYIHHVQLVGGAVVLFPLRLFHAAVEHANDGELPFIEEAGGILRIGRIVPFIDRVRIVRTVVILFRRAVIKGKRKRIAYFPTVQLCHCRAHKTNLRAGCIFRLRKGAPLGDVHISGVERVHGGKVVCGDRCKRVAADCASVAGLLIISAFLRVKKSIVIFRDGKVLHNVHRVEIWSI